ncbi:MAG: hypothetical protein MUP81_02295 [Dehalococcoidia bacterium]|nr:hypothetical protein [Dehalococcoidia bacterium]
MQFSKDKFVKIETMNTVQAIAFIIFLGTERERHLKDVELIDKRIAETKKRFGI